ncbi:hypothetical protein BH09VER1_BH09VER1_50450 [soil metagenome]
MSAVDTTPLEVLAERLTSCVEAEKWKAARALASRLVKSQPSEPRWWMIYALCMRRTGSIHAAQQILLKAVAVHQRDARMHFDLARYTCAAGQTDEAKRYLQDAIILNRGVRDLALDGPDLKPIWDSIN